jgi:hypothetical protein
MGAGIAPLSARRPLLSDADYKGEIDIIANEVFEATYIYHVMEGINDISRQDEKVLRVMNEQPMFWQALRAASQAALFLCLGRIFDAGESAKSIHRLLRLTGANLQVLSRAAVGARKIGHGPKPTVPDEYLMGKWEPQAAADLKFLKDALKPHAAVFESVYKPIRHAVYGHRLMSDDQASVDLFPQTNREAVGKIIDFLHDLVESINELYLNGRKPELGVRNFKEHNQRIRNEARNVMRKLAGYDSRSPEVP